MHFNSNNISQSEKMKKETDWRGSDWWLQKEKENLLRATNLMSDNVTLQNTSLWFSMIVLLSSLSQWSSQDEQLSFV